MCKISLSFLLNTNLIENISVLFMTNSTGTNKNINKIIKSAYYISLYEYLIHKHCEDDIFYKPTENN